ncbi:MAG: permease-like cell division protein FtsX, partial [Lachnospiraceae bacterium]
MKISSLGYCIKQGFKNIYRNRLFSLASVATMSACIFLFGIFYSVVTNVSYMVEEAEKNTCLTVFFDVGVTDARIESIGKTIQQMDNVILIEFTSAEEAWEKYKVKYFGDRMDLAEGFEDDNPLADSASYTVYLDSADALSAVAASVENIDGVRTVRRSE